MDYLDLEEEYELEHADELELMNELEEDDSYTPRPATAKPVVKRLFDDPKPTHSQTLQGTNENPLARNLGTEDSAKFLSDSHQNNEERGFTEINQDDMPSVNNKRTVSDLFGDITDLELEFDGQNKRQKLEEQSASKEARQDMLIKTIVEMRNKLHEEKTSKSRIVVQDRPLQDRISTGPTPKWPFVPVNVKGERIYIRLHSEDKVKKELENLKENSNGHSLLGVPFKDLYNMAVMEMSKKAEKKEDPKENIVPPTSKDQGKDLWVEKYKPRIYLQLLSDEGTNRSLLYWLKLWDKVVFNREPALPKHGFLGKEKRELLDEHHRPVHKVALLCGPPGLGKTTLAHMIAKQAGYCPIEINASDDRSAQTFKVHLESSTQMKSVIGQYTQPNCLILDEIDGAPQAAVDILIKYVSDKGDSKSKKKKSRGILKRPIICICNDMYVPALRSLRQIAYNVVFPPTSSTRLGERLVEISKLENLITDLGTMMALSEKSNNDIRSCLSVLQYLKSKSPKITLSSIQSSNVGSKDMQKGLFSVWEAIFQIKLNRRPQSNKNSNVGSDKKIGLSNRSVITDVIRTVQSYGDYDRLAIGVFENYAQVRSTELSMNSVVKSSHWFVFHDLVYSFIQSSQNYSIYGYLPWAFGQWYLLFASLQRPKLSYPTTFNDATSFMHRNNQILQTMFSGMAPKLQSGLQRNKLLLDVAPFLLELISPNVRPVSIQLFSQKEKNELKRVVDVMTDYNICYSQIRTPEGGYNFQLDPNLEEVVSFKTLSRENSNTTTYTVRQLLSKEIESERIRRAAVKSSGSTPSDKEQLNRAVNLPEVENHAAERLVVPNHLQKLTPKALKKKTTNVEAKDFFGRVVKQSLSKAKANSVTDEVVKSDIWFHFKEGYNNAVRKKVYISDLLK